ncbi:tRNA lysidine(34) synthetase TilS [Brevibacillus sp. TJ4]|uniref:tRNA lysidine(34) synthetase TilS n=1 Tax=Brevibacillus sp. TJ4 TaxID=3234853 RepID=UPI003BA286E3
MLTSVRNEIEQQALFAPHETIVVGLSGGNDSTALLHILATLNQHYQYGWKLHAVHLNHGFRGDEARQDALYAEQLCESLGVAFHLFVRDVPSYMKETGMGAQEASRKLRYRLYREVAEQCGATKVALAHHADDQVETILFRLVRGTRLGGLAGMPRRRWLDDDQSIELVRPLLSFSRRELEAYCQAHLLAPREDSSNQSRKYKRNLLRLEVMPRLQEVNDKFREHILQAAEAFRQDEAYLQQLARERLQELIVEQDQERISIDNDKFQSCDVALQRRMITLILSYLSKQAEWSSQHVETVLHMSGGMRPSTELHLPHELEVNRVYGQIHFRRNRRVERIHTYCYKLVVPGVIRVAEGNATIRASYLPHPFHLGELLDNEAVFDADRLPGTLHVRNRKPGDRLVPFGFHSDKKLKELLIDAKVPRNWRDKLPLLTADDQVIWVPGVRRSAAAPISAQTRRILHVRVEFGEDWQGVFA